MRVKKFLAVMMSAVMLCSAVSISAFADTTTQAVVDEISPYYESARRAESLLTIMSNSAECSSDCEGFSNVVQISVEQTLEKYSGWFWIWNEVEEANWNTTNRGSSIFVNNTRSGLTSGTYRLKSVFTLTNSSGKTETITVYSDEKMVG